MSQTGRVAAVSGSSGLIGRALCSALEEQGWKVRRIVRHDPLAERGDILLDAQAGRIDAGALEGLTAVIHLAGENIGAKRWSPQQKELIRSSRVDSTRLLATTLAGLSSPPAVFICASAFGIYGDRGDEWLDEDSPAGSGFLAEVSRQWEAATEPASSASIRTVNSRFSMILDASDGALAKMLPLFRAGLGGPLASGRQYMSWISLSDAIRALQFILDHPTLSGPVNLSSPEPVRNAEFARILGRVLQRPAVLPAPAFALRLALGEMAGPLLIEGARVRPRRLLEAGFQFLDPELENCLHKLLAL